MVSLSNFNLQMLQIVALCSQTVAGFRAKPKLLQTVNKLLQSVAEPKKTGRAGITFSRPGLACYSAADCLDPLRGYSFTVWPPGDNRTSRRRPSGGITERKERKDHSLWNRRRCAVLLPAKKQSRIVASPSRRDIEAKDGPVPTAAPAVKVRKKNETVEIAAAPISGNDGP